jgi:DivIVA domain-containing protein
MPELTALDILGTTFAKRLNGYAPDEVHEFLTDVANAVEALVRERGELRQRVHHLEQELSAFRDRERALQDALVAAQRSAESTVQTARSEGQRIVDEGQQLADRLVEDAHARVQKIERVISELRSRRREVRAELVRMAEMLQGVVRDDQHAESEERSTPQLAVLQRRGDRTS